MDEYSSHQANSFDEQTQGELLLSPQEAESHPPAAPISLAKSSKLPSSPKHSPRHIGALVIGLLVLLLLGTGGSVYAAERTHISGASASIRITPDSQQLSKTYPTDVTPNSTDFTLNPIGARTVSITTAAKSLTIPATGTNQIPATYATGIVNVMNGNIETPTFPAGNYTIQSNSGVSIEVFIPSPLHFNQPRNVSARAVNPGPTGNIRSTDINGDYVLTPGHSFYAENLQPFSGGRSGYTVPAVSQNDIENATSQLTKQLQDALPADQTMVKSRLAPSEQLLDPANIQCKPSVKVNRNPNDQASDVTATGTMTCSAIAYTPAKLQAYGAGRLAKDANAQWNGSYILVGQVQEKVGTVSQLGKAITFILNVQGLYMLQLNPGLSAHLASLVASQTQAEARTLLLQQTGINKVSIQVSGGFGTALPSSPKDIQITIL